MGRTRGSRRSRGDARRVLSSPDDITGRVRARVHGYMHAENRRCTIFCPPCYSLAEDPVLDVRAIFDDGTRRIGAKYYFSRYLTRALLNL